LEEEKKKTFLRLLEEEKLPYRKSSKILIYNSLIKAERPDDSLTEIDLKKTDEFYEKYYNMTLDIEEGVHNFFQEESTKYLKHVKSIVMNLQSNKDFVERILSGQLIAREIGTMNPQDFASEETKQRRKKLEEESFNARRSDWNRLKSQNVQGIYRCGKCKTYKTTYYQAQIRRADEPMTTFVSCLECGHSWKF
jgi:transcription elongation factor S-II